jgi:hypothetical protein
VYIKRTFLLLLAVAVAEHTCQALPAVAVAQAGPFKRLHFLHHLQPTQLLLAVAVRVLQQPQEIMVQTVRIQY